MEKGGYRVGSGRKKGYAALEAEKAREYIAKRLAHDLEPIISKLLLMAKNGDTKAANILLDRAYGKTTILEPVSLEINKPEAITGMRIIFDPAFNDAIS